VLKETAQTNIIDQTFDKDIGDETDSATLDLELEVSQISYRTDDIDKFLKEFMSDQIAEGYALDTDRSYFTITDSSNVTNDEQEEDAGAVTEITALYTAYLLPNVEVDSFTDTLTGKSVHELESFISTLEDKNVIGYELNYDRKLPFLSFLPYRAENLNINLIPY